METTIFQGCNTNHNLPGFWEKRNDKPFLSVVELICNQEFNPKKTIFINHTKTINKSFHALFIVSQGDIIVKAIKSISTSKIIFQMYIVMDIKKVSEKRFDIITELMHEHDIIDNFEDKFGEKVCPILEAAVDKFTNTEIMSNFSQPHMLNISAK